MDDTRQDDDDAAKLALWQGLDPMGHAGGGRWSRKDAAQRQALRQIRQWTRERFLLADEETIVVAELACALPGCPPLETVIAFWTGAGKNRHHIKIFKRAIDVSEEDLPPRWMKNALVVQDGANCECC